MAKPELGSKHQCQNCGARFFDLNKNPITCPKCGTIFQAPPVSRAVQRAAPTDDEDREPAAPELVSLEDADADADKLATVADEDVEIEVADDTFLEEVEEDGDDDVVDLIDGDRVDDEEP